MKVINGTKPAIVSPVGMRDGEIGIIRRWPEDNYLGLIVQKYMNDLISLGKPSGMAFLDVHLWKDDCHDIEILPQGTQLEI